MRRHLLRAARRGGRAAAIVIVAALGAAWAAPAAGADSATALYRSARASESRARARLDAASDRDTATLQLVRTAIGGYEALVREYPRSGYCDDALWRGAQLAADAFTYFGQPRDRATAVRLIHWLQDEYPHSQYAHRAPGAMARSVPARTSTPRPTTEARRPAPSPVPPAADVRHAAPVPTPPVVSTPSPRSDVRRTAVATDLADDLPPAVDVPAETEHDSEDRADDAPAPVVAHRSSETPQATGPALLATPLLAVGTSPTPVRRSPRPTIYPGMSAKTKAPASIVITESLNAAGFTLPALGSHSPGVDEAPFSALSYTGATTTDVLAATAPGAPAANLSGGFSMARQLGLGISRIVIDPGHGGRDPGAQANGITEADLTLDIALRLETLLKKQPGIDVVLTRRTDVYIPLQERTAIANRAGADLFLSIHANASRNAQAHGIETYFLNFASDADEAAVAARENAASGETMGNLPDLVKAIALNNKLNESRDFATMVQQAMYAGVRDRNADTRDLGVKQAPFAVLIGAAMPSVLAEISFVTNDEDARYLKSGEFREAIAESLLGGILQYQHALKTVHTAEKQK